MAAPGEIGVPQSKPVLYMSLSGTEREDWQKQLLIYGLGVFSIGVLVGWAGRSAKAPTCSPRVRRLTEMEIYSVSRKRRGG